MVEVLISMFRFAIVAPINESDQYVLIIIDFDFVFVVVDENRTILFVKICSLFVRSYGFCRPRQLVTDAILGITFNESDAMRPRKKMKRQQKKRKRQSGKQQSNSQEKQEERAKNKRH